MENPQNSNQTGRKRLVFNPGISDATSQQEAHVLLHNVRFLSPPVVLRYSVRAPPVICCVPVCVGAAGVASISSPTCQSFDFPPARLVIETGVLSPEGCSDFCLYANPRVSKYAAASCSRGVPGEAGVGPH